MNTAAQAPGTAIGQSVGIRAGATIIDIVIFWALSFVVAIATGETSGAGFSMGTLGSCLVGIIGIAYYVVMETMYGGTVGKLALGSRCEDTHTSGGRKSGASAAGTAISKRRHSPSGATRAISPTASTWPKTRWPPRGPLRSFAGTASIDWT